jgi:hypothetical protein
MPGTPHPIKSSGPPDRHGVVVISGRGCSAERARRKATAQQREGNKDELIDSTKAQPSP